MNNKLKIGVIGCGNIAKFHIDVYIKLGYAITALADLSRQKVEEKLKYSIEKNGEAPKMYHGLSGYKQLLEEDIEAVSICVPPGPEKDEIILYAMKMGKSLLIEKPLTTNIVNIKRMLELLAENQVIAVCYNWRTSFLINKLVEIIHSGVYGNLREISVTHVEPWNYLKPDSFYTQVGYLYEHNIHDINYLHYLNGTFKIKDVKAYGRLPLNPSSITINLDYNNGVKGEFHSMNGTGKSLFYIKLLFDNEEILAYKSEEGISKIFSSKGLLFESHNDWLGHEPIILNFLNSILKKEKPKSTLHDSYNDLVVLNEIKKIISEFAIS